jgi:5-methylthioribose kinase
MSTESDSYVKALIAFLKSEGHLDARYPVDATMLPGGISCLTTLISNDAGQTMVVKEARSRLAVADEWLSSPERIGIEAEAIKRLGKILPGRVPGLLFMDHAKFLLGMEAVPMPHDNWKTLLLQGQVSDVHIRQFANMLGVIHQSTLHSAYDESVFQNRHFFESLRIQPYYEQSAEKEPSIRSFIHDLIRRTREHSECLTHGDYSPKNILIHRDQLYLLDHEVVHFGDGCFDVGFAMTHFLSKAYFVTDRMEAFKNAAQLFWNTYSGVFEVDQDWEDRCIRHTLGCLVARIRGKSPLEYLEEEHRIDQLARTKRLIHDLPPSMEQLIQQI